MWKKEKGKGKREKGKWWDDLVGNIRSINNPKWNKKYKSIEVIKATRKKRIS